MFPSCEEIEKYAKDYDLVPVSREIYADVITPIGLLRKLAAVSSRFFLLESAEGGEKWARYSFLGFDPILRARCDNGVVTLEESQKSQTVKTDKPMDVLREILATRRAPRIDGLPPFTGGFVGYFSYAMYAYAEPLLKIKRGDFADFELMLFDKVIAYDHLKQKIIIVVNIKTDRLMERYGQATAEIEKIIALIRAPSAAETAKAPRIPEFKCNVSKAEYCDIVEKTKAYIRDGDIFQAVISRQFTAEYDGGLINAYRVLKTTNPSPYMVFMKINDLEIMCSSPETLIRLQNGRLTAFPVAGSRKRGANETQDKALEAQLLSDEKELSEHNMLVDLARNDLGRISKFSSVELTNYMMIHRYSKIMHICSQVEGDIRENADGCSALEAVLPAGTLSGAPKVRACQIINELESPPRGIYGGALGYLDFSGNMDTCIAIRMAVKRNGRVYVQAGGGIVADSVPELEYEESANKAAAIISAIKNAGEVEL